MQTTHKAKLARPTAVCFLLKIVKIQTTKAMSLRWGKIGKTNREVGGIQSIQFRMRANVGQSKFELMGILFSM